MWFREKTVILFLLVFISLFGCKKYAEDDVNSINSPCQRVARKWKLNKITNKNGRDYSDSVIYIYNPNRLIPGPSDSFTYSNLILELKKSKNVFCLETGIRGVATVYNKPFYSGYYEIKFKKSKFKFDIIPDKNAPTRYFFDDYDIIKLTNSEMIFSNYKTKAYFKALD